MLRGNSTSRLPGEVKLSHYRKDRTLCKDRNECGTLLYVYATRQGKYKPGTITASKPKMSSKAVAAGTTKIQMNICRLIPPQVPVCHRHSGGGRWFRKSSKAKHRSSDSWFLNGPFFNPGKLGQKTKG